MKKTLLLLLTVLGFCSLYAVPTVTITTSAVTTTAFSAHFVPNDDCDHYYYVAMTDDEITLWTSMLGVSVDELVPMWGVLSVGVSDYTWTDMVPNTTYKILVVAYDAQSTVYPSTYVEVTTTASGGAGTSVVAVNVSDITSNSAYVVCTPNAETALFYDGLVTADYLQEVGIDSVCTVLIENLANPFYSEDAWTWSGLEANTAYYAIAFGQNADGEWGDTTLCPFTTSTVGVESYDNINVSVYPMPNSGTFTIAGTGLQGFTAQVYALNGQLLETIQLKSDQNSVQLNHAAGNYLLKISDAKGQPCFGKVLIIQ